MARYFGRSFVLGTGLKGEAQLLYQTSRQTFDQGVYSRYFDTGSNARE